MKKLIALSAALALFGAMAFASPAFAGHGDPVTGEPTSNHEQAPDKPTPGAAHTDCVVVGKVTTTPNDPTNDVTHGHYSFVNTDLECVGQEAGLYNVTADGGTDGPCQLETQGTEHADNYSSLPPGQACPADVPPADIEHGSHDASAWSNSNGYSGGTSAANRNKGDINASGSTGFVKFVRAGTQVEAWGEFTSGAFQDLCFDAALVFTPEPDGGGGVTPNKYDLRGDAVIYDCP